MSRPTLGRMSEGLLRIPEVARRLRIEGTDAYGLIERGELEAGKGSDGLVYVRRRLYTRISLIGFP